MLRYNADKPILVAFYDIPSGNGVGPSQLKMTPPDVTPQQTHLAWYDLTA